MDCAVNLSPAKKCGIIGKDELVRMDTRGPMGTRLNAVQSNDVAVKTGRSRVPANLICRCPNCCGSGMDVPLRNEQDQVICFAEGIDTEF